MPDADRPLHPPKHGARRAHIVGGSLGGLFAALLLQQAGWRVRVHERAAGELAGRGAGIVTHAELFAALAECGITPDDGIGVAVASRVTLAPDGSVLGRLAAPQVLTAWGRLYQLLRQRLPPGLYDSGAQVVAVDELADGVRLRFADGRSETADLAVAADGIRSTLRQQLLPAVKPEYAGYIAWRGLVEEAALSAATREAIFDKFAFCLPPQEQMLGYPVAGADDSLALGRRRFNFVWYRPADDAALAALLTDGQGRRHEGGIAPPLIRPAVLAAMREAAGRVLAPQFAEVIAKTVQPFFQPIFDLGSPRMAFGRTALLGDAAFVARPHCGMGVTKAAGDALALVRALSAEADVATALRAYETERVAFGNAVLGHARHLGAYMQAQLRTPEERAAAERYRTPEAVMRETASSRAFEEQRQRAAAPHI
jgi:2-polyprenyl-6-methoxyphenol hydroxylase-like FAD-dependent oxidoreductase